jgi:hypothetical protein
MSLYNTTLINDKYLILFLLIYHLLLYHLMYFIYIHYITIPTLSLFKYLGRSIRMY